MPTAADKLCIGVAAAVLAASGWCMWSRSNAATSPASFSATDSQKSAEAHYRQPERTRTGSRSQVIEALWEAERQSIIESHRLREAEVSRIRLKRRIEEINQMCIE